jgi:hypothetical protein
MMALADGLVEVEPIPTTAKSVVSSSYSRSTRLIVSLKVHKIEIFFTPILEFVLFLF